MRLRIYPAHRHRTIGHVDMPRLVRQGALLARGLPRDFPTMPYRRGTPSNDPGGALPRAGRVDRLQRLSRRLHRGDLQRRQSAQRRPPVQPIQPAPGHASRSGPNGSAGSERLRIPALYQAGAPQDHRHEGEDDLLPQHLQCAGGPSLCQANNATKNFTVDFSHTFAFDNYAYAVYGRLYRALATFSLTPVIYQLRLQAASIVAAGCHRSAGSGHRIRAGQSVTRRRSARRRLP